MKPYQSRDFFTAQEYIRSQVVRRMKRMTMKARTLAKLIDMSDQTVSYLLNGERNFTLHQVFSIARALDMSVHELLPTLEHLDKLNAA